MRAALMLGVLALLTAVPAAGSTPNARILFNEGGDLVTLDADGTTFRNLTPGNATFYVSDSEGSWSPDGSRLVFTSHRDSNVSTEIYVMDAGGSNQQRLTHDGPDGVQTTAGNVFDTSPQWSPAGTAVAYLKSVKGDVNIWLMAPDGSGQHALTSDTGQKSALSWSPDGRRLLYQTQEG